MDKSNFSTDELVSVMGLLLHDFEFGYELLSREEKLKRLEAAVLGTRIHPRRGDVVGDFGVTMTTTSRARILVLF